MKVILARRLTSVFVAVALVSSIACAGKTPPTTTPILPPTASALLITTLGALQAIVIAGAGVDGISVADSTTVVNAVGTYIAIVQAGATGWVSAVDVGIAKLPGLLSPSTAATLGPYLAAVEAAITILYGTGIA